MRHETIGEMPSSRQKLWRMAALYVPLTVGALLLTGISLGALAGGTTGAIIPLTILLIVTGAVLFQAVTALRDLRAQPVFTRGEVLRTWSKGGVLWFFRSHYVMIKRQVFVMEPEVWIQIGEGDIVECHHWPRTKTLIRVMLLKDEDPDLDPNRPLVPLNMPSNVLPPDL